MPTNLRRNKWTNADESLRILAESHTVPSSGEYREVELLEVPRQDAPNSSVRVYETGTTSEFTCDSDAQVYEGNPTTIYGNEIYQKTGRDGTGLFYRYRSLLEWTSGSLPSLVDQVLLRIYLNTQGSGGFPGERTIGVHEVQAAWAEGTVQWSNQPAHNLVAAAQFKVTVAGWYDVDITTLYQSWFSGGTNHGVLLKDANDPDVDNSRSFSSRTGANPPKLVIAEPGDLYTEVPVNTAPAAGQVAVQYQLGYLRFNAADAATNIKVDYWGTGSLLKA